MEISLHLKPLPLAAVAVCRLIYCRLSPDCQLSTTNRATRAKQQQHQTKPNQRRLWLWLRRQRHQRLLLHRRRLPTLDTRHQSTARGSQSRATVWFTSVSVLFHFVRPSVCLSAAPPIGRVACPPNAAARNNSLQCSADTQRNKLKPNNN